MGLEKAIEHKKEHRKKYRHGKTVDETCRNHGGRRNKRQCPWCLENRLHQINKEKERANYDEE